MSSVWTSSYFSLLRDLRISWAGSVASLVLRWSVAWKIIQTWRCLCLLQNKCMQPKIPKSLSKLAPYASVVQLCCGLWRRLVAEKFSKTAKSNPSLTRRWKPLKYKAANNTTIVLHMLSNIGWVDLQAKFSCCAATRNLGCSPKAAGQCLIYSEVGTD